MAKKRYLVLVGLALFLFILMQLNLGRMAGIILGASPFYIILALFLVALSVAGKGLKWLLVVRAHGCSLPFPDAIKYFCIGFFVSLLTPGRVGEFLRAFYLRERMPLAKAVSTVLVDRLIDVSILLALGAAAIATFACIFGMVVVPLEMIAAIIIAFCAGLFLFLREKYVRLIARPLFRALVHSNLKEKFALNFSLFYAALKEAAGRPVLLFYAVLVGLADWAVSITFTYFLALALGIAVPFHFMLLVLPIIALVDLVPISISSIGTRDIALIFLFSFYSVSAEAAVAFSLAYLFIGYVLVALAGAFFFMANPVELKLFGGEL